MTLPSAPVVAEEIAPVQEPLEEADHRPPRILRRMLVCTIGGLVLVAGFNFLVDPLNLWGVGILPTHASKATRDLLYAGHAPHMKVAARVALVGSSRTRTGFWIPSVARNGILNAGIPDGGLSQIRASARVIARRDDVELVVLEASFFHFLDSATERDYPELLDRLDGAWSRRVQDSLLGLAALRQSWRKLTRSFGLRLMDDDLPLPWEIDTIQQRLAVLKTTPPYSDEVARRVLSQNVPAFEGAKVDPERLQYYSEMVDEFTAAGKPVVIYVPLVSEHRLELIRQTIGWPAYLDWKRQLTHMAPVWDFGRSNALSANRSLFRDNHHYRADLGWPILRCILAVDGPLETEAYAEFLDYGRRYTAEDVEAVLAGELPNGAGGDGGEFAKLVRTLLAEANGSPVDGS